MRRRAFLRLVASLIALLPFASPLSAADGARVSGPIVYANLAIYLVHGSATGGAVPLTLQEALAKGSVKVRETGSVNELTVENVGNDEVFVQAGDIVKGGRQDRVLSVDLLLPPRSGEVPIAAFCVEHGRWTARGNEDGRQFSSASSAMPSHVAMLAMRAQVGSGAALASDRTGCLREPCPYRPEPAGNLGDREGNAGQPGALRRRARGRARLAVEPAALAREREAQSRRRRPTSARCKAPANRATISSATFSPSTARSTAPMSMRRTRCSAKCGASCSPPT